jgi:molybdate transport repressor ModE-like protein
MGVQNLERDFEESLQRLAWDDVRIFFAVASAGSFKAAARALNLSTNTVRNHIRRLEDVVGTSIVDRSHSGVTLTLAGRRLGEVAKEMASASRSVAGTSGATRAKLAQRVDLHITEGVGTFWIVPRLVDFRRRSPDIAIRLNCSMEPTHRFADSNAIAVQMVRPDDPNAVCLHLGSLHLLPFASRDYIREYGVPKNLREARAHRMVLQTGEQLPAEVFPALFGEQYPAELVALETNSSAAHYWAIAKGLGIGMLPTYARAITKNVIPIDMGLVLRRDLWLSYPIAAKGSKPVATVIRWIRASFDHSAYPWFSDDFVHPDDFEGDFCRSNVVNLFSGFMDDSANSI